MSAGLSFFVPGRAIPQGSKTLGTTRDGRTYMRESAAAQLKPWRSDIVKIATNIARLNHWAPPACVHAHMVFRFNRPRSHYRSGRFAHLLKADAPPFPNVKPDGDKLVRAVFDALTLAGIVKDDATITSHYCARRYTADGQRPGLAVVITDAVSRQDTLL